MNINKPILSKLVTLIVTIILPINSIGLAADLKNNPTVAEASTKIKRIVSVLQDEANTTAVDCSLINDYSSNYPIDYSAEFVSVQSKPLVATQELFNVKVLIKNTGNQTWFSDSSGCSGRLVTRLGTTRQQDRPSAIYNDNLIVDGNWLNPARVKMTTKRVAPGEIAEFSFWAKAPESEGIYREYFAPVVEGKTWIKGLAEFNFDTQVGNPYASPKIYENGVYLDYSTNVADPELEKDKSIVVDLSEQKMNLKIGNKVIKTYKVSTGKPKTPTPVGKTKISLKQEVRVAASKPHYIMPKFMMFRAGGYGIHALPSLANDKGVFWREALNHIGSPRSHGCVRLLPQDAEFAFAFADVGTTVEIVR